MNTITIELCAEDRARLDKILEALTAQPIKEAIAVVEVQPQVLEQTNTDTPTPEEPIPDRTPDTEEPQANKAPAQADAPQITMEQIQQKVVQLVASGADMKAKVREIVHAYAPRVSDLPEDKYGEIWDKLTALEKGAE